MSICDNRSTKRKPLKHGIDANEARQRRENTYILIRKRCRSEMANERRGMHQTLTESVDISSLHLIITQLSSDDLSTLTQSCRELRQLSSTSDNPPITEIYNTGVLSRLAELLSHHDMPSEMRLDILWILTNLLSGSTEIVAGVYQSGVCDTIIRFLLSNDVDTVNQSCWAVGNLLGESNVLRKHLIQNGIINILLQSYSIHKSNESFLRVWTWTVAMACKEMVDLESLSSFIGILYILMFSSDHEILINTMAILDEFSDSTNESYIEGVYCQSLIENDIVKRCFQLFVENNENVLISALGLIGNVSRGSDTQTQYVASMFLPCASILIQHDNSSVRKNVCWILSNICASNNEQTLFSLMGNSDLLERLVVLLENETAVAVRHEAIHIIRNITLTPFCTDQFIQHLLYIGLDIPVYKCLKSKNDETVKMTLEIILQYFNLNTPTPKEKYFILDRFEKSGLQSLVNLTQHENGEIRQMAYFFIHSYWPDLEMYAQSGNEFSIGRMSQHRYGSAISKIPKASLTGIQFGSYPSEVVRRRSVAHINKGSVKESKNNHRISIAHSSLGTYERTSICSSCMCNNTHDVGHHGHHDLVRPMYDPEKISFVKMILDGVCYKCGRCRIRKIDKEYSYIKNKQGFVKIKEYSEYSVRKSKCRPLPDDVVLDDQVADMDIFDENGLPTKNKQIWETCGCGTVQPIYYITDVTIGPNEKGLTIVAFERGTNIPLPAWDSRKVFDILKNIPTEDLVTMGLNPVSSHPLWFMIDSIVVPTPNIHPSMIHDDESIIGQDAWSTKLQNIVKLNMKAVQIDYWLNTLKNRKLPIDLLYRDYAPLPQNVPVCVCSCVSTNDIDVLEVKHRSRPCSCKCVDQWLQAKIPKECTCKYQRNNTDRISEIQSDSHLDSRNCESNNTLKKLQARDTLISILKRIVDYLINKVQYEVATYIKNPIKKVKAAVQRDGKLYACIVSRHRGKRSRFRGTMSGKRADNNARTPIIGNPHIPIGSVGIPYRFATELTFPEIVTEHNFEEMQARIRNGPELFPGANLVIDLDGNEIDLAFNKNINLKIGMTVERHVKNGDYVIFNRQPTLHRMSMMAHKVIIILRKCIEMNDAITVCYAADFDGDEMNIHMVRDPLAVAEAAILMNIHRHVLSPRTSLPIVQFIQDTVAAAYRLSETGIMYNKADLCQILSQYPTYSSRIPEPATRKKDEKTGKWMEQWTGKQVLSCLFPLKFSCNNMTHKRLGPFEKNWNHVSKLVRDEFERDTLCISNGDLLFGRITKDNLNSFIHLFIQWLGCDATVEWMNSITNAFHWALHILGLTVSISDFENPVEDQTRDIIDRASRWVDDHFLPYYYPTLDEETAIRSIFKEAQSRADAMIVTSLRDQPRRNHALEMIDSKSKGTIVQLRQIMQGLFQQEISGSRPFHQLSIFSKRSGHSATHGFIKSCFKRGISPSEILFHYMGGQEGLVATSVKTAKTGELARQLIKIMESLSVQYDNTVRNAHGNIYQLMYGDDGFEASSIEKVLYRLYYESPLSIRQKFSNWKEHGRENMYRWFMNDAVRSRFEVQCLNQLDKKYTAEEIDRLILTRRSICIHKTLHLNRRYDDLLPCPIHFPSLIQQLKDHRSCPSDKTDLTWIDIYEYAQAQWSLWIQKKLIKQATLSHSEEGHVWRLSNPIWALFSDYCSPTTLWFTHHVDKSALEWLFQTMTQILTDSRCHPGEMVGTVASHSCSEAQTQNTLNTHRYAGIGQSSVAPRFSEIINATIHPQCVIMNVYLKEAYTSYSSEDINKLTLYWSTVYFSHFVDTTDVISTTTLFETSELAQRYRYTVLSKLDQVQSCKYSIIFNLNKKKCAKYFITPHYILQQLTSRNVILRGDHIWCVSFAMDQDWKIIMIPRIVGKKMVNLYNYHMLYPDVDTREHEFAQSLRARIQQTCHVIGFPGITSVRPIFKKDILSFNTVTQEFKSDGHRWCIEVYGQNIMQLLTRPEIDPFMTSSNYIHLVHRLYGIVAVTHWIEIQLSLAYESNETSVEYRNLQLLTRCMTMSGSVVPMKNTFDKNTEVMERVSNDRPTKHLTQASIIGEYDHVKDPSSCIMAGKASSIGTGSFQYYPLPEYKKKCIVAEHKKNSIGKLSRDLLLNIKLWEKHTNAISSVPIRYVLPSMEAAVAIWKDQKPSGEYNTEWDKRGVVEYSWIPKTMATVNLMQSISDTSYQLSKSDDKINVQLQHSRFLFNISDDEWVQILGNTSNITDVNITDAMDIDLFNRPAHVAYTNSNDIGNSNNHENLVSTNSFSENSSSKQWARIIQSVYRKSSLFRVLIEDYLKHRRGLTNTLSLNGNQKIEMQLVVRGSMDWYEKKRKILLSKEMNQTWTTQPSKLQQVMLINYNSAGETIQGSSITKAFPVTRYCKIVESETVTFPISFKNEGVTSIDFIFKRVEPLQQHMPQGLASSVCLRRFNMMTFNVQNSLAPGHCYTTNISIKHSCEGKTKHQVSEKGLAHANAMKTKDAKKMEECKDYVTFEIETATTVFDKTSPSSHIANHLCSLLHVASNLCQIPVVDLL